MRIEAPRSILGSWSHRIGTAKPAQYRLGQGYAMPTSMPSEDGRIVIINKNNPVNHAICSGGGGSQGGIPGAGGPGGTGGFGGQAGAGQQGEVSDAQAYGNIAAGVAQVAAGVAPLIAGTSVGQSRRIGPGLSSSVPHTHPLAGKVLKPLRIYPQQHLLRDVTARNLLRQKRGVWGLGQVRPNLGRPIFFRRMPTPRLGATSAGSEDSDRGTVIINKIFPTTTSNANTGPCGGCCPGTGTIPGDQYSTLNAGTPPAYPPHPPHEPPNGGPPTIPVPTGQLPPNGYVPITPVYQDYSVPTPTGSGGPGPGAGGDGGDGSGGSDIILFHMPDGSVIPMSESEAALMEAQIALDQELRRQATSQAVSLPSEAPYSDPVSQGTFFPLSD